MLSAEMEKVGVESYPYLMRVFGVTEEEYQRITNEDTRYELIDGVLIMHSPASIPHERVFRFMLFLLDGYVQERTLGEVFGSRATLRLASGRDVEPDLMFVASANIHRVEREKVDGAADLVIEILSQSTRDYDLEEKRPLYQESGVGEIWFVDPERHEVIVDTLGDGGYVETRRRSGRLQSTAVPGFWLDLSWLWQAPPPPPLPRLLAILG